MSGDSKLALPDMTLHLRRLILALLACLLAGAVQAEGEKPAEVPRGLWETPPDRAGVILHVRTRRCGRALCGRVERAKNRRGYDTPSNAVGNKVLWELQPRPDGSFLGEYRGPTAKRFLASRVEVAGRELRLDACDDTGCERFVWTRIR